MSTNNNNNNKITRNKINKIKRNVNRRVNAKIRSLRRNIRKINRRRNNNRIPAANTKSMNRDFKILYQDGNTVKVTGRDLVYKIPSDITDQEGTGIITVIPANPCYWLGTRIAALAQGYQNYRPLNMKFTYIPQCAVTQQGNVIAGTLWNQAPSNDNMQQSLRTSNGGQMSQCYKGFTSIVRLKSNLQYNLYKTAGQFDQESNPFLYIAMAVGCKQGEDHIIPGYFYVTWSFLLKNPIGNTNIFNNSGITTFKNVVDNSSYENKTIVFLTPEDDELQMGSIIQLEKDTEGEIQAFYNGSYYDMADDDIVWYFSNSTIAATNAGGTKRGVLIYQDVYDPEEMKNKQRDPNEPAFYAQFYFRENYDDPNYWRVALSQESLGVNPGVETKCYYIQNLKEIIDLQMGKQPYMGYLATYDIEDEPEHQEDVEGWYFNVLKAHVDIVDVDDKKNASIVKQIRNKAKQQEPKEPIEKVKDKLTRKPQLPQLQANVEEKPQLVDIQPIPFTKAQRIKSKAIKTKLKYPEAEYDQFSASELFN